MRRFWFLLVILSGLCMQGYAQYTGTASVSQGPAAVTQSNVYTCTGGRITNVGTITASDNTVWTVPAVTGFSSPSVPFASDLYNSCNGHTYPNTTTALAALDGSDVVTVDADGELITAFVFADNYFELYINGVNVGKDRVPYTPFNSSILRFKVRRPFSIAFHLVDWEEHLGLGAEASGGFAYHDGDGGLVAIFKDSAQTIIAKTGPNWRAQTFYTAPIQNLSCPTENGTQRLSNLCSTADVQDGSMFYALHWALPTSVFSETFDDANWPMASTYTNDVVGVNNKPAYTNFIDLFDAPGNDAEFIWSTNLILDNEVVVRFRVPGSTGFEPMDEGNPQYRVFPNPVDRRATFSLLPIGNETRILSISVSNAQGQCVFASNRPSPLVSIENMPSGLYFVALTFNQSKEVHKLIVH